MLIQRASLLANLEEERSHGTYIWLPFKMEQIHLLSFVQEHLALCKGNKLKGCVPFQLSLGIQNQALAKGK